MTSVLIRRGEDKETEGRKPHEDGGRDWNDAAMSQGTLPPEAGRGRKDTTLEVSEGV